MSKTSRGEVATQKTYARLYRHLEKECRLYEAYIELLLKQKEALTHFQIKKIEHYNVKRAEMVSEMDALQHLRREILSVFPEGESTRLSTLIGRHFPKQEKRRFLAMADVLRSLVEQARVLSTEFGSVTQFALNMVHGSLSLFHRARQSLAKSYSPGGKLQESYVPQRSRHETVLKQA